MSSRYNYAQIRIREPAGERSFSERLTVGGEGADVIVPGRVLAQVSIERQEGQWVAVPQPGADPRFDGQMLATARELRREDVLAIGDAQLSVAEVSRTLLRLDIHHLVGNATIAPVSEVAALALDGGDEDLEIHASQAPGSARAPPVSTPLSAVARQRWAWGLGAALAILVLGGLGMIAKERVEAARIAHGKLPGRVNIDTGGVAATVSVDGVEAGRAPGEIRVAAGRRTFTLRAPRYLDHVTILDIQGAEVSQTLKATLQPSWGTLKITAHPAAARISVDGRDSAAAFAAVEVPSGVHQVRVTAPGLKSWESSVVVKAGKTLAVGPITLGQPDAQLNLRSSPAGAEISVAGSYRGHAPLIIELPAGIAHEVVATLPGHESWRQSVFAEAGKRIEIAARLPAVVSRVEVRGEPADAELFVDGASGGKTPQTLSLSAVQHRIEVRQEGYLPFTAIVTPAKGLERVVEYRLTSADRTQALLESAATIKTQTGYVLKLVPGNTITLGSERREQGRRPNEVLRKVTLKRPFYIGVTEVTNGEFRKFRPEHASGYVAKQTLDLDPQPVSQLSWDDAAEYCNWLSGREGVPPAYERREGRFHLKRPVTTGYRLPTEAEWEYAARRTSATHLSRFVWGDTLPVPSQAGNFAGAEAVRLVETSLPGYDDGYVVSAPVGKFKANALGLLDMAGNVSEWVNDFYLSFVDSAAVTDPLGPEQAGRHVVRGSSWKSTAVSELRLAWRDTADEPSQTIGFRIARYAE